LVYALIWLANTSGLLESKFILNLGFI
jgi:hypothetical protein